MRLRSLGYRTDLIFPRFEGDIQLRDGYLVIRTPKNPHFYWGNFLLFDRPPEAGDLKRWKEIFAGEIGAPPETNHTAFGWDSPLGEFGCIEPFLEDGFKNEEVVVLTASSIQPSVNHRPDVEVRALQTEEDWEAAFENQVAYFMFGEDESGYRKYKKSQMVRYRLMAEAGVGNWYGAFLDGKLVGDLGVYVDPESKVGRYQKVGTHPDFRGRGVCATLVAEAGHHAQGQFGLDTLLITADPGYHAIRIYESVGFRASERQIGVCRA